MQIVLDIYNSDFSDDLRKKIDEVDRGPSVDETDQFVQTLREGEWE